VRMLRNSHGVLLLSNFYIISSLSLRLKYTSLL